MKVFIRGKSKNLSKKEIRAAVRFFADKLLSSRLKKYITVYITYNLDLPIPAIIYDDDDGKMRTFHITVSQHLGKRKELLAIAHETVHIKQAATGQWKQKNGKSLWNGEVFNDEDTEEDYWQSPIEIDAYGREVGLYEMYMLSMKAKKNETFYRRRAR
jgi:hypothetical protein